VSTIIIQDWNIKVAYFFPSIWPNFRVALTLVFNYLKSEQKSNYTAHRSAFTR